MLRDGRKRTGERVGPGGNQPGGRRDRSPRPVVIDEWQRHPAVWDWVRRSVDRDPGAGRFLRTGSATPVRAPTHSGAGRIVLVRMRPMALAERGVQTPSVSLRDLLSGERPPIDGDTTIAVPAYTEEILRSGFPALRALSARPRRAQLDGYLARIVEHDFPEQGHRDHHLHQHSRRGNPWRHGQTRENDHRCLP